MCRLTLRMVRSTLVTAWFLADWPTRTSPFLAKATTEGVVREPSEFAITVGSPPSRTVTTELVVPRSIPTDRAMELASLPCAGVVLVLVVLVLVVLVSVVQVRGSQVAALGSAALRGVHSTFLPRLTAARGSVFPTPQISAPRPVRPHRRP